MRPRPALGDLAVDELERYDENDGDPHHCSGAGEQRKAHAITSFGSDEGTLAGDSGGADAESGAKRATRGRWPVCRDGCEIRAICLFRLFCS
jgi:hypothetical protein